MQVCNMAELKKEEVCHLILLYIYFIYMVQLYKED